MDAEKVIKSSVELGLLNESDVPACSRFLAGAIGTDEIIEKLQIFKFGEHYRLLEKVENEDTKSFLSDYSEPCSSSIAERISSDTGTVKKYYREQVSAGRRRPSFHRKWMSSDGHVLVLLLAQNFFRRPKISKEGRPRPVEA